MNHFARALFLLFGAVVVMAFLSTGLAYLEFRWRQIFSRHRMMAAIGWCLAGAIAFALGLLISRTTYMPGVR